MKSITILIYIFFSVFLSQKLQAKTTIPFSLERNSIFIYCSVNGNDSLKFLFDTGADGSVINEHSFGKSSLKLSGTSRNTGSNGVHEVDLSRGNSIKIGSIIKNDIEFAVIPYGDIGFDGVLGTNLMNDHIIQIDYDQNVIIFYERNDTSIEYDDYIKMSLFTDLYPTYIECSIIANKVTYKGIFGLDTGADDALTIASPFAKKHDFKNQFPVIGKQASQGSDGAIMEAPIIRLPEVLFAQIHLYRIPTSLSQATEGIDASEQIQGFFGNAFLKKFNTIIDYKGKAIYFKLNHHLYSEFYD